VDAHPKQSGSAVAPARGLAILIGIAEYQDPALRLDSPARDVARLGEVLRELHHFDVHSIVDSQATKTGLRSLLHEQLATTTGDRRLIIYFAGHGVARDSFGGLRGYLVPFDGGDDLDSLLSMDELAQAIDGLPCRQLLLILDCCFAGVFRWSASRDFGTASPTMYQERFERMCTHRAWQALTAAAHDELASDVDIVGMRLGARSTSPFLSVLVEALEGSADEIVDAEGGDGVITATDLYQFIRKKLPITQTAGIWPLRNHQKGEFIFLTPHRQLRLKNAIELTAETCPYRGFEIYEEEHEALLFGRDRQLEELVEHTMSRPMTIVLGRSGVGKSSLVRAGLIPKLKRLEQQIIGPFRPGSTSAASLEAALATPIAPAVLIIDQLEELYTQVTRPEAEAFVALLAAWVKEGGRVVCTLRIDLEPQMWTGPLKEWWSNGRFALREMTQDQLREVIESPAEDRMLLFDPPELVDELTNAVIAMPGGLPLLSFTLAELYRAMLERTDVGVKPDRTLKAVDYEKLGGVAGALQRRLDEIYGAQDELHRLAMKYALLRMVTVRGGAYTRRPVPAWELDEEANPAIHDVLETLRGARLVVAGPDNEPTVEPAHDAVIGGWSRLKDWLAEKGALGDLVLHRELTEAAGKPGTAPPLWTWDTRRNAARTRLAADRLNAREREFLRRSDRNRRWSIVAANALALLVVALIAYAWWQDRESERSDARAREQELKAAVEQKNAQFATGLRLHGDGVAALLEHDATTATALLAEALVLRDNLDTRARLLEARVAMPSAYWNETTGAGTIAVSPVRAQVALVFRPSAPDAPAKVALWDVASRRKLENLPEDTNGVAAFSPDGKMFAYSGTRGDVWLVDTGGSVRYLEGVTNGKKPVRRLVFDASSSLLGAAREDGTVTVYDLTKGNRVDFDEGESLIALALSGDGKLVAAGGSSYSFSIRDRATMQKLGTGTHRDTVQSLAFDATGKTLVSGGADGVMKLWAVPTKPTTLEPFQVVTVGHSINDLAFDPRQPRVALACEDGVVRLWDSQANQIMLALAGQRDSFFRIAFSSDGRRLFAGAIERSFNVWELDEHGGRTILRSPLTKDEGGELYGVFSTDGRTLMTASSSGAIRSWSVKPPHGGDVVRQSPNEVYTITTGVGGWVATAGAKHRGGSVFLWNMASPANARQIPHDAETNGVSFDLDGRTLLTGGRDYKVRLWDVASGASRGSFGLTGSVWNAAFSPTDPTLVATGDGDKVTALWRLSGDGAAQHFQFRESGEVWGIAFSQDGNTFASGGVSRQLHVWKLSSRAEGMEVSQSAAFTDHTGTITSIAYGKDPDLVASGGMDGVTYLTKISARASIPLRDHTMPVWWVAMSRDGAHVASGGLDGRIALWRMDAIAEVIWNARPAELAAVARSSTGITVTNGAGTPCERCGTIAW
jgi:WD40 repeat protein